MAAGFVRHVEDQAKFASLAIPTPEGCWLKSWDSLGSRSAVTGLSDKQCQGEESHGKKRRPYDHKTDDTPALAAFGRSRRNCRGRSLHWKRCSRGCLANQKIVYPYF